MTKKMSRRQFLLSLLAAGAAGLTWTQTKGTPFSVQSADDTHVYLPFISKATPEPTPVVGHRVVRVHHSSVTTWTGSGNFWSGVDQAKTNAMVNEGMKALTGQTTVAAAWRSLLPNYSAGQGIAVKLNFNNSIASGCPGNTALLNALPQPTNAVIDGLLSMGVRPADIWLYDGLNRDLLPYYYDLVYAHNNSVKFYGKCHLPVAPDPDAVVNYSQGSIRSSRLADVLVNATYLINMPILKGHQGAIFTAGFKNHFGTIDNPSDLHSRTFFRDPEASPIPGYSPLVDLFKNSNIRGKTILTIGEGIYGAEYQDLAPVAWSSFGNDHPKSLLFSTDPVAIDRVMADLVDAEWHIFADYPDCAGYLQIAQNNGLGITGVGDPHQNQSYNNFDYRIVNL